MTRHLVCLVFVLVCCGARAEAASGAPGAPGVDKTAETPKMFRALTLTYETMAALDWLTTTRAISNGARESNPLLAPMAGQPAALLVARGAAAGATIYVAKRLWKRNRVAAVATLVAANVFTAVIVAHNASVGGPPR